MIDELLLQNMNPNCDLHGAGPRHVSLPEVLVHKIGICEIALNIEDPVFFISTAERHESLTRART